MPHSASVTDDWKRNWQQSIAVKISGVVLWIVMPIVLITSTFLLRDLEDDIAQGYEQRSELVLHAAIMLITSSPNQTLEELQPEILKIRNKHNLDALVVKLGTHASVAGTPADGLESITKSMMVGSHMSHIVDEKSASKMVEVTCFHVPVQELAKKQRTKFLLPIILGFLLFGIFLIWAIRNIVHKPLQQLVDATQAVSAGDYSIRVDMSGQDEFASLSRFFNEMLEDLVQHQAQLQEAAEAAKAANTAKSAFLANMSHELRTPLNAIIGYSEMIAEELTDAGQDQFIEDLDKIHGAGNHLLELINNILDLSKIEAGKIEAFIEPVSLATLLRELQYTVQPLISRNNNVMEVKLSTQRDQILTDFTKLKQLLINLVGNAAKFTENGQVQVAVDSYTEDGRDWLHIRVTDTGIGMTSEQMKQVFDEFSQADSSTTRRFGGTGLGLALAEHFCLFLGGKIEVDSTVGQGTVFHVYLPAEYDSALSRYRPAKITLKTQENRLDGTNN